MEKVYVSAGEWKMIKSAFNHGTIVPADFQREVLLGYLMRVNSTNVLDEGLRIRGRGRRMNLKVKIRQTRRGLMCIENKRGTQWTQSQSIPG
jgi:hypothetical protein